MENISTQRQEQKTIVRGTINGSWVGECVKWGFIASFTLLLLGFILWLYGGIVGIATDVSFLLFAGCITSWFVRNAMLRDKYKTEQLEFHTHFFSHNQMVIGDRTTEGYKLFFVPQGDNQVQDEPLGLPEPRKETWEQMNDRHIWEKKHVEQMTLQGIVDSFDKELGMTIGKVRSAIDRHEKVRKL